METEIGMAESLHCSLPQHCQSAILQYKIKFKVWKNKTALQKKKKDCHTLKKNFPSIIREKLRYSFTTNPACLARNAQGCPEGWHERTLMIAQSCRKK